MLERDSSLPNFEKPPVVEVALAVHFEPLEQLRSVHTGLLWEKFRDRFPIYEDQSPIDRAEEDLEGGGVKRKSVKLKLASLPPLRRAWFLNEARDQMLQFQVDRFAHNWRKSDPDDKYPRYESIREMFSAELDVFDDFLESEFSDSLSPNLCEIVYVNIISSNDYWQNHSELSKILSVYSGCYSDGFLTQPENTTFSQRHLIRKSSGEAPLGRIHIEVNPIWEGEGNSPAYHMKIFARGAPISTGKKGIEGFLDLGREWIVRSFASITTSEMHKIWERTDVS